MPASPANQPKASWKARFDALIQPYIPEYFPVAWKMVSVDLGADPDRYDIAGVHSA